MVLSLVVVTVLAYEYNFRKSIIPGVRVLETELSGYSAEEATKTIEAMIKARPLEITLRDDDGGSFLLDSKSFDLVYDVPKTVAGAWQVGRSGSYTLQFGQKINTFLHGQQSPLIINFNEDALEVAVASAAANIDIQPVMPKIVIKKTGEDKEVVFVSGENGSMVNQAMLIKTIEDNLNQLGRITLQIPIDKIETFVDTEKINKTIGLVKSLMDRKIIIKGESYEKTVGSETLVKLVNLTTDWAESEFEKLAREVAAEVDRQPQDARFEFSEDRLVDFAPNLDGIELEQSQLITDLKDAVTQNKPEVKISVIVTEAKIKAGEINSLGIQQLLGSGKSSYAHSIPGRIHNVSLAASKINGIIIGPGEVFSFNQALGDVSRATGYQTAYIIKEGRTVLGDGGGVCQVSTTLFRAVLATGLPVIERHAHAYRVGYYEQDSKPGIDATVFDPSADLKFENNTARYLLIQAKADPETLKMSVDIYGSSDGRVAKISTPKMFSQSSPPENLYVDDPTLPAGQLKQIDFAAYGGKVAFDYSVERGGEVIYSKTFYSNYRPWQAVYLRGTRI